MGSPRKGAMSLQMATVPLGDPTVKKYVLSIGGCSFTESQPIFHLRPLGHLVNRLTFLRNAV